MPRKAQPKSAKVRAFIEENPTATTKEIVAGLKAKGVRVSSTYVYGLRAMGKAKKAKAKRQKVAAMSNGIADAADLVRSIKELAGKAGGYKNLESLVKVLGE